MKEYGRQQKAIPRGDGIQRSLVHILQVYSGGFLVRTSGVIFKLSQLAAKKSPHTLPIIAGKS